MSIGWQGLSRLTQQAREENLGGMIALIPTDEDARRLARWGYEKPEVLHVTLYYLGELNPGLVPTVKEVASQVASTTPVFAANAWASCHFNPTGEDPCATYLVGGQNIQDVHTKMVNTLLDEVDQTSLPPQHVPWVPHITIGYYLNPEALSEFGPVTFDKIRVALGPDETDFPLVS